MPELDPQIVAEMLASGYDPKALSAFQARRGVQPRQFETLGASKGPPNNFLTDTLPKAAFGDPDATVRMPVDQGGRVMDPNLPPSAYQGIYGQEHPAIEAGTVGGMAATGAPEMMARSLLTPALQAGKAAVKAAPLTTTAGLATAGTLAPTGSGKTPWEVMQDNWERQRGGFKDKMAAEDAILSGEAKKLEMSPEDNAALNQARADLQKNQAVFERWKAQGKADVPAATRAKGQMEAAQAAINNLENRGGRIDTIKKQSEAITGPASERRKTAETGLASLEEEIKRSQLPIREKVPGAGYVVPAISYALAGKTGDIIGRYARGLNQMRADKVTSAVDRAQEHILNTTLKRGGGPSAQQFKSPEGKAIAANLQGVKNAGPANVLGPLGAIGVGGAVGAGEAALAPMALTGFDAMNAPGGSPLSQASGVNAVKSPSFWAQSVPEILTGAGIGGLGALKGSMKSGPGWKDFGPVSAPMGEARGLANAAMERANAVAAPKMVRVSPPKAAAAPKAKGKGKGKAAGPLDDIPDL